MVLEFARPEVLLLLLLLPAWGLLVWPRAGRGVLFSHAGTVTRSARSTRLRALVLLGGPVTLRSATAASLILALSGPQRIETVEAVSEVGRGIGLVLDLSTSMLADDMEDARSRLEVAREAAVRFAERRSGDELSLVAFGGEALTRVPPTTDARVIVAGVESLEVDFVRNGTDVSGAVLTAMTQLLGSDREPRIVVLLTDGAHNQTGVQPYATGRAAAALGIRVHSISMASAGDGDASGGASTGAGNAEAAETVLSGVAALTGGTYFRATSAAALDSIYREIDRIESPSSAPSEREERRPLHRWFLVAALLLLTLEVLLRGSRWGVLR
ncbi:MAG TPA: VWA domain-containing protein [Longimicrobiales bacterium]|nr:VWA domain-containing protein [Longimicrobiales bacterium]